MKQEPQQKNKSQKRVSIDISLAALPLIYGLEENRLRHNLKLHKTTPEQCGYNLQQGVSDLALIPAIDYGKTKEPWSIIPDICIAAGAASKRIQLFFNKGLRDIKRIAVNAAGGTEAILLRIILQEKYEIKPEYIELSENLDTMLQQADAALLTRDNVLANFRKYRNRLDINEEWVDLTGLPFVYNFWAGREFIMDKDDIAVILKSYQLGKRNVEAICRKYAEEKNEEWSYYHDFITKDIHYDFGDSQKEGLNEFYNYAFYYGFLEYIPEFHFFKV